MNALHDPAVERWLTFYLEDGRSRRRHRLGQFHAFLQGDERFRGLSPSQLIEFQVNADKKTQFLLLDALQSWIRSRSGTHHSLTLQYSDIRNFFKKNRAPLPDDDFQIRADRPPVSGRLTADVVKVLIQNVKLGRKAFYLTLWMSVMDLERFTQFNESCGDGLVKHLKEKGVNEPFLFEYPGRKQSRNKKLYHTFVGHDALVAWKEYFERFRGYPKSGEPIYANRNGRGVRKDALQLDHLRLLEELKYIHRGGDRSKRYGYNLHEFRDTARTLLHVEGKKDGLDQECVEFWMGHTTDPNQYDKFYRDKNYTLEQYRIAEKHLNIISGAPTGPQLQNVDELIDQIIKNQPACQKLINALTMKVGAKLAPIENA